MPRSTAANKMDIQRSMLFQQHQNVDRRNQSPENDNASGFEERINRDDSRLNDVSGESVLELPPTNDREGEPSQVRKYQKMNKIQEQFTGGMRQERAEDPTQKGRQSPPSRGYQRPSRQTENQAPSQAEIALALGAERAGEVYEQEQAQKQELVNAEAQALQEENRPAKNLREFQEIFMKDQTTYLKYKNFFSSPNLKITMELWAIEIGIDTIPYWPFLLLTLLIAAVLIGGGIALFG